MKNFLCFKFYSFRLQLYENYLVLHTYKHRHTHTHTHSFFSLFTNVTNLHIHKQKAISAIIQ